MKNEILTTLILVGLMLTTDVVHANYKCKSADNTSAINVNEDHITHLGNASIEFTSGDKKTWYFGTIKSEGGMYIGKKVIELYPFQGDSLTIVSKPKVCGRVSCDFDLKEIITAKLKIGETSTFYYCDETSH